MTTKNEIKSKESYVQNCRSMRLTEKLIIENSRNGVKVQEQYKSFSDSKVKKTCVFFFKGFKRNTVVTAFWRSSFM